jgi:hypothetical protein
MYSILKLFYQTKIVLFTFSKKNLRKHEHFNCLQTKKKNYTIYNKFI